LDSAPRASNSTYTSIRTFFSLAKSAFYLPKNEETEAEARTKVKTGDAETEIFTPEQMKAIRASQAKTASRRIIPISDNLTAVKIQNGCGFE
jgi:hypothetical protein